MLNDTTNNCMTTVTITLYILQVFIVYYCYITTIVSELLVLHLPHIYNLQFTNFAGILQTLLVITKSNVLLIILVNIYI